MPDIKTIRSIMENICAGRAKMTDQQIMLTWVELPSHLQAEYLAGVKPKAKQKPERKKDADNAGPENV